MIKRKKLTFYSTTHTNTQLGITWVTNTFHNPGRAQQEIFHCPIQPYPTLIGFENSLLIRVCLWDRVPGWEIGAGQEEKGGWEENLKFLCCSSDGCLAYSPPSDMNIQNKLFPEEKVKFHQHQMVYSLKLRKSSQRNERGIGRISIIWCQCCMV